MKIVGFAQLRNELEKGNLENWFRCMLSICDFIYIFDQNSTDGSLEYYKKIDNVVVIESPTNRFEEEMICKNDLLQKIIIEHPDYEDEDFNLRLKEHNIAFYMSEEIPYLQIPTSWNYTQHNSKSEIHFHNKWNLLKDSNLIEKKLTEENYNYNIGECENDIFLDFSKTIIKLPPYHTHHWLNYNINILN